MDLLLALQNLRSPALDAFFLAVTRLGEELFVLVPLLLLYWCVDRKMGLRMGFLYFACGMVGQMAKLVFCIQRPFIRDARLTPHPRAIGSATGYSFPSGHTTSAASLAASAVTLLRRKAWVWALSACYVLLVGLSRLYLGVHTPGDVLGAILITGACAFFVDAALRDCEKRPRRARYYIALCILAIAAMIALAAVRVNAFGVPAVQAADGMKTAGAASGLLLGLYLERRFVRFETAVPRAAVQAVKLVLGLGLALALKEGLKAVLGHALPMEFLRYFLVVLFVVAGYPAAFTAYMRRKKKGKG